MNSLFKDKKIANVLDTTAEKDEFFSALKEKAQGGITREEMKKVLGTFRSGKGKNIDGKEAEVLAGKIFPNAGFFESRYIYEKPKTKQNSNISKPKINRAIEPRKSNLTQNRSMPSVSRSANLHF